MRRSSDSIGSSTSDQDYSSMVGPSLHQQDASYEPLPEMDSFESDDNGAAYSDASMSIDDHTEGPTIVYHDHVRNQYDGDGDDYSDDDGDDEDALKRIGARETRASRSFENSVVVKVDPSSTDKTENGVRERKQQSSDASEQPFKGLDFEALRRRRKELAQESGMLDMDDNDGDEEDREFEEVFQRRRRAAVDGDKENNAKMGSEFKKVVHPMEALLDDLENRGEYVPAEEPKFKTHMARKIFRMLEAERREHCSKKAQEQKREVLARTYYVYQLHRNRSGSMGYGSREMKKDDSRVVDGGLAFSIKSTGSATMPTLPAQSDVKKVTQSSTITGLPLKRMRSRAASSEPGKEYSTSLVPENVMQQLQDVMQTLFKDCKGSTRRYLRRKEKKQKAGTEEPQRRCEQLIIEERTNREPHTTPIPPAGPVDDDLDMFGGMSDDEGEEAAQGEAADRARIVSSSKSGESLYFPNIKTAVSAAAAAAVAADGDQVSERARNLLQDIQKREIREQSLVAERKSPVVQNEAELRAQVEEARRRHAEVEARFGDVVIAKKDGDRKIGGAAISGVTYGDEDFGLPGATTEYEDYEYDSEEEEAVLRQLLAEKRQDAQALRGFADSVARSEERRRAKHGHADDANREKARRAMKEGVEFSQVKSILKRKFGTDIDAGGTQSAEKKKKRNVE